MQPEPEFAARCLSMSGCTSPALRPLLTAARGSPSRCPYPQPPALPPTHLVLNTSPLHSVLPPTHLVLNTHTPRPPAVPEDYIEYFKEHNVKAVVRLNKKMYEASRFTEAGVRHHEMYFPDGTCPSEQILLRFLDTAEREPGALAVSGVASSVVGRGRKREGGRRG